MSTPPVAGPTLSDVERVRVIVGRYFTTYETRITPVSLLFLVNVDEPSMEAKFNALSAELWRLHYVPQIRLEHGEHVIEIVKRPERKPWSSAVNWVMLVLTLITTLFAGAFLWMAYEGEGALNGSDLLMGGLYFAVPLMTILGLHELAHFFMARRHHVEASMPFFLPMPPPFVIFGTFGAFISLREPIPNRKALMDIGVSGPLAGFAVAIPVTLAGLFLSIHSPAIPITNCGPTILSVPYGDTLFGASAVWWFLSLFFPASALTNLNPLAIAGWVGLLITSINLLPAGQLDGGHVFRALLGKRSVWLSMAVVMILLGLGFFYTGWFLFAFLVLILGVRHPPPLNDLSPLDFRRKALGMAAAAILIGGFAIVPIAAPTGDFSTPSYATTSAYHNTSTAMNATFTITDKDIVGHAYTFSATVTPSPRMGNASLHAYLQNLTCTIAYSNHSDPCTATEIWVGPWRTGSAAFTLGFPKALATVDGFGGSTSVVLHLSDPAPTNLTGTITVSYLCQGQQNLQYGGPQTVKFAYQPPVG